ncbi:MAG: LysR family transcriptional regulator [Hydrogenophaga sp.]|nr:LysR family transcriptional regulator [Hydrogenophaga sp.]
MHPHLDHRLKAKLRLRHLELLDVLGDTLNVHHAAPRLSLSQSATSKLLQEAEHIYGATLFERQPRGLRATAAGAAAIRTARLLLHQVGESVAEVHLVAAGATGRVRVGALPVAIPTLISQVLQRVRTEMPNVVVTLTEGTNEMLLPALTRNELDLVVGRLSADTQDAAFMAEPLYEEPVRLVVRRRHPLLRKRSLSIADLANVQWVLPPALAPMRQQLERVLTGQGLPRPTPHTETTSQMLVEIILNQTDMVAAMPARVAELYQSRDQLAILDLFLPIAMPSVGLLLHASAVRTPVVESFLALLRKASAHQPTPATTPGNKNRRRAIPIARPAARP